jgi:hypothetical protein
MSYTKAELETICDQLGFREYESLPIRLDRCATSLFVAYEHRTTRANMVREALRDLNKYGHFRFKD